MVSKKSSKPTLPKKATAKSSASTGKSASPSTRSRRVLRPLAKSVPVNQSVLEVNQKSVYRGNDWWEWSVWIEASAERLDQIEYVEYKLHPTFPEQVLRHTNRREKFRLDSEGWGEFMIAVEIKNRNGERHKRQHWLTLEYPAQTSMNPISSSTSSSGEDSRPTIFLSAGVTDLRLGNALGSALEQQGFEVLKMENASPSVPWERSIALMTKQADLMVVLISGGLTSWGMREIDAAMNRKLPILPIVIGPSALLPEQLQGFEAIPLKDASDPIKIAPGVAQQIKQSIKH
jgi:hypothetical protein